MAEGLARRLAGKQMFLAVVACRRAMRMKSAPSSLDRPDEEGNPTNSSSWSKSKPRDRYSSCADTPWR